MRKYKIELSEDQLRLVANCLEDISRFAAGQCELRWTIEDGMMKGLPFTERIERRNKAQSLLNEVKRVLLPDLRENESLGYCGTDFIGNTYQIYRTMLYQLAKDNDWNNVYSSPSPPSGNMGTIKIERIEE